MGSGSGSMERWGTRIGVILAVTGSAVGLGNFLRFPGLAAKYEGGAFMIPYFIALLVLGIPLAWAEWAMGRYGGCCGFNSAPGIYRSIWRTKASPYFGVLAMIVPVIIYMYYVLIESWCLGYAWEMASGGLELGTESAAYGKFFGSSVGAEEDGSLFKGGFNTSLVCLLVCFVVNFVLIYRGLSKGIEWFCKWAMPALVVCALIVLVRVLTLGTPDPAKPDLNVINGLGYMWNLRTDSKTLGQALADGKLWLEASGQIFFSLSVGFGIIVNYASYLRKDDDIALSGLTSCAGNEFCEVALGGMITIPAAFIFLGAAGVAGSSFDLGFKTLPMVFQFMPLGRFVGTVFFILLFLAALTSSLSMLQPAIALLEEGLGLGRKASVALLGFVTIIGSGFVAYFSKDTVALDAFDFWAGTFCLYLLATFQVLLFGWAMGVEKGMAEINRGASLRVPVLVGWIIKYICPVYLLLVLGVFLYQNAGAQLKKIADNPVVAMSVGFIIVVAILFALFIAQSVRRWTRQEAQQAVEESP